MTTAPPSPTLAANTLTANPRGRAGTLAQIGLLIQWQFRRLADMLVFMIIVQALLSATTIFGFGLLIGDPPPEVAAFLVTGAPTVTLITVGLVMAPQAVSQSKLEGSLGWMRTLPVPRWGFLAADLLMWTLIALPGTVLGILAGQWRFDAPLSLSPWLALAAPLVSLIAACIGYSMALLLKPQLAHL
ncbi:MAG: ABC transporter permease, partial [Promicromonosporaceae bacterium]|nr:ABC transporter permease [Promicromonosporaceae bacterium]